jgi:hypothetical protein
MKKFNLVTICLIVLGATLFTACKKDKPSQTELLNGKWKVISVNTKDVEKGIVNNDAYAGKVTDFITFKENNVVEIAIDGPAKAELFTLLPNNKIIIAGDEFDIKTLTANSCILFHKDFVDDKNFEEQTVTLSK